MDLKFTAKAASPAHKPFTASAKGQHHGLRPSSPLAAECTQNSSDPSRLRRNFHGRGPYGLTGTYVSCLRLAWVAESFLHSVPGFLYPNEWHSIGWMAGLESGVMVCAVAFSILLGIVRPQQMTEQRTLS